MKRLRILIADDHKVVREGLVLLISAQSDMRVVGEADNGREALAKAKELKPDVIVMDLSMPELGGLQATQLIKSECPDTRIVALTVHEDESYLLQLCRAQASGYVLKRSAGEELIQAIRIVAEGGLHFDATIANKALARQAAQPVAAPPPPAVTLSHREKEVLVHLAWGYSNKEIAGELGLSTKTVETYRVRIREKLGLRSRTEAVRFALQQGWLKEGTRSGTG